jgi:hypothetical protein
MWSNESLLDVVSEISSGACSNSEPEVMGEALEILSLVADIHDGFRSKESELSARLSAWRIEKEKTV